MSLQKELLSTINSLEKNFQLFNVLLILKLFNVLFILKELRNKKLRRWWVKPHLYPQIRSKFGAYDLICTYFKLNDHEEFYNFIRMSVNDFIQLHDLVKSKLSKQILRRTPIKSEIRLASVLNYLGHGGSVRKNAIYFHVGLSTMYEMIYETCEVITEVLLQLYVPFPDENEWRRIAFEYENLWNFPNCVGSIDGKHIRIKRPPNGGSLFWNYKKFNSIVLMAICDANSNFIWFNVGDYGSMNDSSVFDRTSFSHKLKHNLLDLPAPRRINGTNVELPFVFVGDEIFPLESNLMKPYSKRVLEDNLERKIFNYRLSRARKSVECGFGILCKKWTIFERPLGFSLKTTDKIIAACICLHNFIRKKDAEPVHQTHQTENQIGPQRVPCTIRDTFAAYFSSPEGAIPWQNNYI